ncbi:MAG: hypothetical protein CVV11_06710 [Gammaproteobacteria bacterium HGW-Gammaproteobacteria-15]|nr:MAG: hypothetical protein CVV11_06710 [Gammaproteobacteria bacterium HGW-Gammaproteobacteria-15]
MADLHNIFEVKDIYLSKANFELHDAENANKGGVLKFTSSAQNTEIQDQSTLTVEFLLNAVGTREDIPMFEAACGFTCVMKIKSLKKYLKVSEHEKTAFAVKQVYPLVRHFMTNLMIQSELGGIQLPITPEKFISFNESSERE